MAERVRANDERVPALPPRRGRSRNGDALKSKGAMPLQTELPGLEAAPEVVAAAIRGWRSST